MGLLDYFRPKNEVTLDNALLEALLNNRKINRENAMSLPAVSSAVNLISDTFAQIPIRLYEEREENGRKTIVEIDNDERVLLINNDTKDTLDGMQFKKALCADYLLGKGGYAYINKKGNKVKSLHYVQSEKVNIYKNNDPIFKEVQIEVNGAKYQPYDFIKILRNTKDGASGKGVIDEVAKAIDTAYQTMLYQLQLISTGGNKRGFIQSKHKLGENEMKALKEAWRNMYSSNTENTVILNDGIEFKEASNNAVELQLNESKKTLDAEINDIFHIKADFSETVKLAVLPICEAFVTALNRDLLLEREKNRMYFVADYSEMLKASLKERYESYKIAKETGFLTLNEIRIMENMETIEGLDVIAMSLGNVLFDIEEGEFYVPNTGEHTGSPEELGEGGNNTDEINEPDGNE